MKSVILSLQDHPPTKGCNISVVLVVNANFFVSFKKKNEYFSFIYLFYVFFFVAMCDNVQNLETLNIFYLFVN